MRSTENMKNRRLNIGFNLFCKVLLLLIMVSLPLSGIAQDFWQPYASLDGNGDSYRIILDSEDRIFVGVNSVGVFYSWDDGVTWRNSGLSGAYVGGFAVNAEDDIFVAVGDFVYRSTNHGFSWQSVSAGLPGAGVNSIAIDADGRIFVGLFGEMIYRSQDNGTTWTALSNGLSTNTVYVSLAINSSGHIFAGTNGAHVYRSQDHGNNWQRFITGLSAPEVWALEIDSEDRIFAGTANGICISVNNGTSWSLAPPTEGNFDVNDMTINSEGHIFATNYYGGIWRTTDHGTSWETIEDPTSGVYSWGLAVDSEDYLYCGTGGSDVFKSVNPTTSTDYPFTRIDASLQAVSNSSVKWGDYDNDGDQDILMVGTDGGNNYTKIYRNDGGETFTDLQASSLQNVVNGPATWGDYDNDGDLDVLMTGYDGVSANFAFVYRNDGSGVFTDQGYDLIPMGSGSVDWVDYDNDGDLDIFTCGWNGTSNFAIIYRNDALTFTDINADLQGVRSGVSPWGDYDNDGDLDLLLTGWDGANSHSLIYQNNEGIFTDIEAGLSNINGAAAWGDYDNDGDLDIIQSGYGEILSYNTVLYRNSGGSFSEVVSGLPSVNRGSLAWGDYDNDGDLDILLTGNESGTYISDVFENNNGTFSPINAGFQSVRNSSVGWADYDNDGDLDILLTGQDASLINYTHLYRNDIAEANSVPDDPNGLSTINSDGNIVFSWNAGMDDETPSSALTYSLRIGTSEGSSDMMTAHANPFTGYRQIVGMGNLQNNLEWTIRNLDPGVYYWSVQAVDNAFAGSEFANEQTFSIGNAPTVQTQTATSVDATTATLNGSVNSNGFSTDVRFEYGLTTSYGTTTDALTLMAGNTNIAVSEQLNGLVHNTLYHYRVIASNSVGSSEGEDQVFTTLLDAQTPVAITEEASDISYDMATLNGSVNSNGESTDVSFEYGPTTSYGTTTAVLTLLPGNTDVPVSSELTNLEQNTTYHYRVIASNAIGSSQGADQVFTTLLNSQAPVAITEEASDISYDMATLNGSVNSNGESTDVSFEYGPTTSYGTTTAVLTLLPGTTDVPVSAELTNLDENTLYHFRLVASNVVGQTQGLDQVFTTDRDYPVDFEIEVTTEFPSYESPEDYEATDYRLIGFPGASDLALNTILSGTHGEDWQVFWDNGAGTDYLVEFNGGSDFELGVGKAFWVIHSGPIELSAALESAPLNSDDNIEIPLHSGWNLISNPILSSHDWASIQSENGISEPIWRFDGSFSMAADFEAYRGYYYFNGNNLSTLNIPYKAMDLGKVAPVANSRDEWRLQVMLDLGEHHESSLWLGTAPEAELGRDALDYVQPHSLSDQGTICFDRPEWDDLYPAFATDIRPPIDGSTSWDFSLDMLGRSSSTLRMEGLDLIPDDYAVFLIDLQNGRSIDLRQVNDYTFTPQAESMNFRIAIGSQGQVQEEIQGMIPVAPVLCGNYPNPFNPTTRIRFGIPTESLVSMNIYDVRGNVIKTFDSRYETAGWHEYSWNGVDDSGQAVPTGVYLSRFEAGGRSQTIKMLYLK